jgi:hypothetical protein
MRVAAAAISPRNAAVLLLFRALLEKRSHCYDHISAPPIGADNQGDK